MMVKPKSRFSIGYIAIFMGGVVIVSCRHQNHGCVKRATRAIPLQSLVPLLHADIDGSVAHVREDERA